jgi:hypothetical protein
MGLSYSELSILIGIAPIGVMLFPTIKYKFPMTRLTIALSIVIAYSSTVNIVLPTITMKKQQQSGLETMAAP